MSRLAVPVVEKTALPLTMPMLWAGPVREDPLGKTTAANVWLRRSGLDPKVPPPVLVTVAVQQRAEGRGGGAA